MKNNRKKIVLVVLVLAIAFALNWMKKTPVKEADFYPEESTAELSVGYQSKKTQLVPSDDVSYLSSERVVVSFVKENHHLPDYYITKSEARRMGWNPAKGNLCEVLHGSVIGGDYFNNFEKQLPTQKGRKWYEADLNYDCGKRTADRLLFSNDGLIFVTYDHYKTFQKR